MTFEEWVSCNYSAIDDTWVLAMMQRSWNASREDTASVSEPVAVMWYEPGSGKPRFAGLGDTVQAGTWERGTKLYAASVIEPDNSQAVALSKEQMRITQLQDALELAFQFIDDAQITDGQWHWAEEARAALSATANKEPK